MRRQHLMPAAPIAYRAEAEVLGARTERSRRITLAEQVAAAAGQAALARAERAARVEMATREAPARQQAMGRTELWAAAAEAAGKAGMGPRAELAVQVALAELDSFRYCSWEL